MAGDCFGDPNSQNPRQKFNICQLFVIFVGVLVLILGFTLAILADIGDIDVSFYAPGLAIFAVAAMIITACSILIIAFDCPRRQAYNVPNTTPTSPTSESFSGQTEATGLASSDTEGQPLNVMQDSPATFNATPSETTITEKVGRSKDSGVKLTVVAEIVSPPIAAECLKGQFQSAETTEETRTSVDCSAEIATASTSSAVLDNEQSTSGVRVASLPIDISTSAAKFSTGTERETTVRLNASEDESPGHFSESFSGASLISSESDKGLSPTDIPPLLSQSSSDTSGSFILVRENGPVPVGNNLLDRQHNVLPLAQLVQNHFNPAPAGLNMAVLAGFHNPQNVGPHNQQNVGPHQQNGVQLDAAALGVAPEEFDMGAALAGVYNQNPGLFNPNPGPHQQNGGVQLNAEAFGVAPEEFNIEAALAGAYNHNAGANNQNAEAENMDAAADGIIPAELNVGALLAGDGDQQNAEDDNQENAGAHVLDIQIQEEIPLNNDPLQAVQGEIIMFGMELVVAALDDVLQNNPAQPH